MTNDEDMLKGDIHPNGQITVPKLKREELDITDGDTIYFKIFKVIASDGMIKYEKENK